MSPYQPLLNMTNPSYGRVKAHSVGSGALSTDLKPKLFFNVDWEQFQINTAQEQIGCR